MRGSVPQSIRFNLADKLHPSAPLTTTESSRLLTALTSSFRQQLNRAHPDHRQVDNGKNSPSTGGKAGMGPRAATSSASFAQKHMTSVLTSPLLNSGNASNIKGYASAKAELARNPKKDPVDLLQEYEEDGAANFSVVQLCLRHAQDRYFALKRSRRADYLQRVKPGSRILSWLLNSSLHDISVYADNAKFFDQMAFLVLCEQKEHLLWDWMSLDLSAKSPAKDGLRTAEEQGIRVHKYRWRRLLLHSLVERKSSSSATDSEESILERLNSALDAFAQATTLGSARSRTFCLPLGHSAQFLMDYLIKSDLSSENTWKRPPLASVVDVKRYERFMATVPLWTATGSPYHDMSLAILELFHPRRPMVDCAYELLTEVLSSQPSIEARGFVHRVRAASGRHGTTWRLWRALCRQTVFLLHDLKLNDEATHVTTLLERDFPELAREVYRPIPAAADTSKPSEELVLERQNLTCEEQQAEYASLPHPAFG